MNTKIKLSIIGTGIIILGGAAIAATPAIDTPLFNALSIGFNPTYGEYSNDPTVEFPPIDGDISGVAMNGNGHIKMQYQNTDAYSDQTAINNSSTQGGVRIRSKYSPIHVSNKNNTRLFDGIIGKVNYNNNSAIGILGHIDIITPPPGKQTQGLFAKVGASRFTDLILGNIPAILTSEDNTVSIRDNVNVDGRVEVTDQAIFNTPKLDFDLYEPEIPDLGADCTPQSTTDGEYQLSTICNPSPPYTDGVIPNAPNGKMIFTITVKKDLDNQDDILESAIAFCPSDSARISCNGRTKQARYRGVAPFEGGDGGDNAEGCIGYASGKNTDFPKLFVQATCMAAQLPGGYN